MIQTRILLSTYISIYIYTHTYVYRLIVELRLRSEKISDQLLRRHGALKAATKRWMGGLELRQNWRDMFSEMEGCTDESSVYAILHVFIVRISRHLQRKHPL